MTSRSDRGMRLISFFVGLVGGAAVLAFIYGNSGSQDLDLLGIHFNGIPVWSVGVVPFLLGIAVGYAYQFPARWYHYRQHIQYRESAEQLQRKNVQLQRENDELSERLRMQASASPTAPATPGWGAPAPESAKAAKVKSPTVEPAPQPNG